MRSGLYKMQKAGYKAFIPTNLPPLPEINMDEELTKKLTEACLLLARLDGLAYSLPNVDLFIAMYVKKEALLSLQIEGTQASLENIFEFESGLALENLADIMEVVTYIKALKYGMERLKILPLSLNPIKEVHAILLSQSRGNDKSPGEFKLSQNWIGPRSSTLATAAYVPPPPERSVESMVYLEHYIQQPSTYPVLIDCALIHYQFETIHPFRDGNGRVGRLLITLYLICKGLVEKPLLYLSYFFRRNRQEYYDRLMMVRNTGNYEQWVHFFLTGVIETSQKVIDDIRSILELQKLHQQLLFERRVSSPLAMMLLDYLFYTPIITSAAIQKKFQITHPTASSLLKLFTGLSILQEVTGKERSKRYVYGQYLAILTEGTLDKV